MLLLTATTDKIQVITGQAVTVDVHSSYMDMSQADPPVIKGSTSSKTNTAITTATTTDVVAAPAASTTRNIKTIHVRNKSTTLSVDVTIQFNQNGTLFELFKTTLIAGAQLEYIEGVGFFVVSPTAATILQRMLTADDTGGQNVATAQPWFPTTGAVAVAASTTYIMEGFLEAIRAAGTTSHTTSLLFGGTATLTGIQWWADVNTGDVETTIADSRTISRVATATAVKAASTSATEALSVHLFGIVRVNAAGTLIPEFQYSVAPGGAPTIKSNSYFRLTPVGDNTFATSGTWS
jgi:hypothetical protein